MLGSKKFAKERKGIMSDAFTDYRSAERKSIMRGTGFLCGPRIYRFRGWTFEEGYCGPYPLNKSGDIRYKPPGRVFWKMYDEWTKLPKSKKARTRIGGGCMAL
jgi:hypothetical protein